MIKLFNITKIPTWDFKNRTFTLNGENLVGVNKWFKSKFQIKKDFDEIAEKVAIKNKVTKTEILAEWEEKRINAVNKGNYLHDYIQKLLEGRYFKYSKEYSSYYSVIKSVIDSYVEKGYIFIANEKVISHYGVNGTIDSLIYHPEKNHYIIIDWKFISKFKTFNSFTKFKAPLAAVHDCHLNLYSSINCIYKLILSDILKLKSSLDHDLSKKDCIFAVIVNFKDDKTVQIYTENDVSNYTRLMKVIHSKLTTWKK